MPDMSTASGHGESRRHFRGSSLMLAGRLIALSINLIVQILIVRYLSKAGYGAFAYGFAMAMLAARFVPLGMDKAASRFLPIYQERQEWERLRSTLNVVLRTVVVGGCGVAAILAGLVWLFGDRWIDDALSRQLLLIMLAFAPLHALQNTLEKLLAIFARPQALFFRRYIVTPLMKLTAVLVTIASGGSALVLGLAYVAAAVAGLLISVVLLRRALRVAIPANGRVSRCEPGDTGRLFRYGLPLLSTDIVFGLRATLSVILLQAFHGPGGVAALRAVLPAARLNQLVFDSFKLLYVPAASRLFARDDWSAISRLYWQSTAWIAALTLPVLLVSFSLADLTVVTLFGPAYESSGTVLALVSLGIYINAAFGFNTLTLRVLDRVSVIFRIDLALALLAVVVNMIIVPPYGAMGAAAASCTVLVAQNLAYQWALRADGRLAPIPVVVRNIHVAIIAMAIGLFAIERSLAPPPILCWSLVVVMTLALWWAVSRSLRIGELFPEIGRFLPQWAIGPTGNTSVSSLSTTRSQS